MARQVVAKLWARIVLSTPCDVETEEGEKQDMDEENCYSYPDV